FRYQGRPLPALKSLDQGERVLYTGTFSKVLLPGLRLAYLVVPATQVDRFDTATAHLPGPGSILPQAMVADFIDQGHFARHLRKMRLLYADRRGYLAGALQEQLGDALCVCLQAGGMHVLAELKPRGRSRTVASDKAISTAASAQGMALEALSDWHMRKVD